MLKTMVALGCQLALLLPTVLLCASAGLAQPAGLLQSLRLDPGARLGAGVLASDSAVIVLIDSPFEYRDNCPEWASMVDGLGADGPERSDNPANEDLLSSRPEACEAGTGCQFHAYRSMQLMQQVCPTCRVIPVAYGEFSVCRLARILRAAATELEPHLIAIPLDFSRAIDVDTSCAAALHSALAEVRASGISVLASAGNNHGQDLGKAVALPAADSCTVAIGAVEPELAPGSHHSRLLADTKYETTGPILFSPVPGAGHPSPVPACPSDSSSRRDAPSLFGGTSAALAVAAGSLGLVKSCAPSLSSHTIERILAESGNPVSIPDLRRQCSRMCDAGNSGASCLPHRRIDLCRALRRAAELDATGACGSRLPSFAGPGC